MLKAKYLMYGLAAVGLLATGTGFAQNTNFC
jgi:hypothetical protein